MLQKQTRYMLLLFIAILFYCLDFFFRISPSLVVKNLIDQYHTSTTGIGAFATTFYLGYVLMQIPSGYILDRLNLRYTLTIAILICTFCYSLFIIGHSFLFGVENRFLIGMGSAISFIATLYIAKQYFPQRYFTLIAGITIALGTLVSSGMQLICATILTTHNWHRILLGVGNIGAFFIVLLLILNAPCKINHDHKQNIKDKNNILSSLKKVMNKKLILNAIIGGLFYLPTSLFAGLWGISFLHTQYHITLEMASLAIMFIFAGWAIGSPVIGYFSPKINNDKISILIGALSATIFSIILIYSNSLDIITIMLLSFLFGFASGFQVVIWNIFGKFKINAEHNGIAIALTNTVIMLIPAAIHLLAGRLLESSHQHALSLHINYHFAFIIIPLAFVLTSFLALVF